MVPRERHGLSAREGKATASPAYSIYFSRWPGQPASWKNGARTRPGAASVYADRQQEGASRNGLRVIARGRYKRRGNASKTSSTQYGTVPANRYRAGARAPARPSAVRRTGFGVGYEYPNANVVFARTIAEEIRVFHDGHLARYSRAALFLPSDCGHGERNDYRDPTGFETSREQPTVHAAVIGMRSRNRRSVIVERGREP